MKLVDATLLAVRSNDSSSWIRRGQLANGTGRESPIPRRKPFVTYPSTVSDCLQLGLRWELTRR